MMRRTFSRLDAGMRFLQVQHYASADAPCFGVPTVSADPQVRQPSATREVFAAAAQWNTASACLADKNYYTQPTPNERNFTTSFHEALSSFRGNASSSSRSARFTPLVAAPEQLQQMEQYCKALLTVAGLGRRAQDYLAGWIATMTANSDLVTIAFQYDPNPADVDAFLISVDANEDFSDETKAMILRCFVFDCMVLLAHTTHLEQAEQVHRQISEFGERLGLSNEFMTEAEEIAREEFNLNHEKFLALEEEDSLSTYYYGTPGTCSSNLNSDDCAAWV